VRFGGDLSLGLLCGDPAREPRAWALALTISVNLFAASKKLRVVSEGMELAFAVCGVKIILVGLSKISSALISPEIAKGSSLGGLLVTISLELTLLLKVDFISC
jgi:hypothetical protein